MLERRAQYTRQAVLSALIILLASGCVVSRDPISGEKKSYGYSWAEEVQLGNQADPQIIAQYGLYEDADLSAYVDSIGQALVAKSHLRRAGAEPEWINTPFYFRVLDSPVVNAFALPGGYVYVTRGLLAHVENEAQLAMVIGHEIGHVAARHSSRRARNQMLSQAALATGAIAGVLLVGEDALDVFNAASAGVQLLLLSYSRADESQSDELGVEYAALGGYDAAEGAGFFRSLKRLTDQSGQEIPSFLQTHPDPGQREQRITLLADQWQNPGENRRVARSWYLNTIDEIVFGENPRHGFVAAGRFIHPDLAFEFDLPEGFQTSNQPTQVLVGSEDGNAIARMTITQDEGSASSAAQSFASQQGLTVSDTGTLSSNGIDRYYVRGEAPSEGGETIALRALFFDYGGNTYSFMMLTRQVDFAAYDDTFLSMMLSFRRLRDTRLLNIQPDRISIQSAPRTGSFESVIAGQTQDNISPTTLAILNQLELTDQVQAGSRLKLVR